MASTTSRKTAESWAFRPNLAVLALVTPVVLFFVVALVFPLSGLFRASFFEGNRPYGGSGFTLDHYLRFLTDAYYGSVLLETVILAFASAVFSLLVGFPVAYSIARAEPRKRKLRMFLVVLPLTLSLVVVVFGWLVLLGGQGIVNTLLIRIGLIDEPLRFLFNQQVVVFVLVQQFLPFMILSIMSVISQIDPALEQAAANLRANRFTVFRRVIIPMAMPGILVGVTLVFILSMSAFIAPRLIGGSRVQMIGNLIFEQVIVILNWPFGAAMSFIVLTITMLLTLSINYFVAARFAKRSPGNAQ